VWHQCEHEHRYVVELVLLPSLSLLGDAPLLLSPSAPLAAQSGVVPMPPALASRLLCACGCAVAVDEGSDKEYVSDSDEEERKVEGGASGGAGAPGRAPEPASTGSHRTAPHHTAPLCIHACPLHSCVHARVRVRLGRSKVCCTSVTGAFAAVVPPRVQVTCWTWTLWRPPCPVPPPMCHPPLPLPPPRPPLTSSGTSPLPLHPPPAPLSRYAPVRWTGLGPPAGCIPMHAFMYTHIGWRRAQPRG
jgi:hypothetical protein